VSNHFDGAFEGKMLMEVWERTRIILIIDPSCSMLRMRRIYISMGLRSGIRLVGRILSLLVCAFPSNLLTLN